MKTQKVLVCTYKRAPESGRPCCFASGSSELKKLLQDELDGLAEVKSSICMGLCDRGPTVKVICGDKEAYIPEATVKKVKAQLEKYS